MTVQKLRDEAGIRAGHKVLLLLYSYSTAVPELNQEVFQQKLGNKKGAATVKQLRHYC
jgi:hypothetical protein